MAVEDVAHALMHNVKRGVSESLQSGTVAVNLTARKNDRYVVI